MLRITASIIFIMIWGRFVSAANLTVGYVPISFPRDPVEFNQFDEHIIVGQILEPLVEANGEGQIGPSIAKDWHFSEDGLQIVFNLDRNKKFSNGRIVNAKDVTYTLRRHMESNSQSKGFLSSIKEIKPIDSHTLVIKLKTKSVSILKALTRDQLGVVPDGWKFDPESNSPYIGTGPYNLNREMGKWFLKRNTNFKECEVPILQWELIFYKDDKFNPADTIPDLMPSITASILDKLKGNPRLVKEAYKIETRLGFNQTSFWADPRGSIYPNKENRMAAQALLNELILDNLKENNFQRSSGMIPVGIQGSLQKVLEISPFKKGSLFEIRIASLGGVFAKYLTDEKIKQLKEKYGVRIVHHNFSFLELKELAEWKPDITAGSWAGGFNDPSGFLGLLNIIFGMTFKDYLKDLGKILLQTEMEDNWEKRAQEFRSLGEEVIKDGLLTPGWRIPMYEVTSSTIEKREFQTRYTPRIVNFKNK